MNKEVMKQVLEALKNNRRTHYSCEDSWYSCPKHEDGCSNEHAGSECNCGADKANVEIDAAIKVLQEAQAQRTWVGLTDEELYEIDGVEMKYDGTGDYYLEGEYEFARAIEAKLKEKNT